MSSCFTEEEAEAQREDIEHIGDWPALQLSFLSYIWAGCSACSFKAVWPWGTHRGVGLWLMLGPNSDAKFSRLLTTQHLLWACTFQDQSLAATPACDAIITTSPMCKLRLEDSPPPPLLPPPTPLWGPAASSMGKNVFLLGRWQRPCGGC